MLLPPDILAKGLDIAKESTFLGVKLEELSKDELLAIAAIGWDKYRQALNESALRQARIDSAIAFNNERFNRTFDALIRASRISL